MITGPNIVTDGLVLHLDAGNRKSYSGSGTLWYDLSGNNNATLFNGVSYSGSNLGSLYFDGVNDYASLGNNKYQYQDNFCVEGFVKYDALPTNTGFQCSARHPIVYNNDYGYNIWIDNSGKLVFNLYNLVSAAKLITTNNSIIGSYAHFVCYKEGLNIGIYLNSVFVGFLALTTNSVYYHPSLPEFAIGGKAVCGNNTFYSKGNIFMLRIYNKVLSSSEITQNYNATKSRFGI